MTPADLLIVKTPDEAGEFMAEFTAAEKELVDGVWIVALHGVPMFRVETNDFRLAQMRKGGRK